MKPNFEKMIDGKLDAFIPQSLNELFDAIRCDWTDHWSSDLQESFVTHLN